MMGSRQPSMGAMSNENVPPPGYVGRYSAQFGRYPDEKLLMNKESLIQRLDIQEPPKEKLQVIEADKKIYSGFNN